MICETVYASFQIEECIGRQRKCLHEIRFLRARSQPHTFSVLVVGGTSWGSGIDPLAELSCRVGPTVVVTAFSSVALVCSYGANTC